MALCTGQSCFSVQPRTLYLGCRPQNLTDYSPEFSTCLIPFLLTLLRPRTLVVDFVEMTVDLLELLRTPLPCSSSKCNGHNLFHVSIPAQPGSSVGRASAAIVDGPGFKSRLGSLFGLV